MEFQSLESCLSRKFIPSTICGQPYNLWTILQFVANSTICGQFSDNLQSVDNFWTMYNFGTICGQFYNLQTIFRQNFATSVNVKGMSS